MNIIRLNKKIHPVYWVENFLSDSEIDIILNYTKELTTMDSKVGSNDIDETDQKSFFSDFHIKDINSGNIPRIRKSLIKWIDLNSDTNWLYKKIIEEIRKVNYENFDFILKYVENLQFTEYNENQKGFYSKHDDCGDVKSLSNFVDIRKLSFSIQLSDPENYEGGELVFHKTDDKFTAPKTKGTIIFFESSITHEVKPVTKGTRYSIVSWVCGPNLR